MYIFSSRCKSSLGGSSNCYSGSFLCANSLTISTALQAVFQWDVPKSFTVMAMYVAIQIQAYFSVSASHSKSKGELKSSVLSQHYLAAHVSVHSASSSPGSWATSTSSCMPDTCQF